jgi:hypothetical protein
MEVVTVERACSQAKREVGIEICTGSFDGRLKVGREIAPLA